MTELKKKRIKAVMKYTWPFYILSALLVAFGLNFLFGITHRLPAYKCLTLFVSGEMKDAKKLNSDLLEKFKDNELKDFSCISADPSDGHYYSKLSIPGYNTADVLIIPTSKLEGLNVSAFALDFDSKLTDYYQGNEFFSYNEVNYGVKIDKTKVSEYFTLPNEDCYMFLNGKSENIGEYSKKQIKEHDNALRLVKDWGK